jgi:hypothetical protein
MYVEYNSNNSGGSWWLKDEDWKALEKAGWLIEWAWLSVKYTDKGGIVRGKDGLPKLVPAAESGSSFSFGKDAKEGDRWLGTLAKTAYKPNCTSLREAVDEWERVTGESSTDAGCPCCGQPHDFTLYDDKGKHIDSGPTTSYAASW